MVAFADGRLAIRKNGFSKKKKKSYLANFYSKIFIWFICKSFGLGLQWTTYAEHYCTSTLFGLLIDGPNLISSLVANVLGSQETGIWVSEWYYGKKTFPGSAIFFIISLGPTALMQLYNGHKAPNMYVAVYSSVSFCKLYGTSPGKVGHGQNKIKTFIIFHVSWTAFALQIAF